MQRCRKMYSTEQRKHLAVRHWRCRKKWKTHLKSCCDSCGDCQYAYCCGCLCRVWSMCTCWSGRTGMTGTLWRSSQSGSLNRRKRACGCIGCRSERRNRIGGSPRHYSMMANRRKRKWWYAGCRNVSGFLSCGLSSVVRSRIKVIVAPAEFGLTPYCHCRIG